MKTKETLPPLREDHQGVIPYAGPNLALYQIEQRLAELLELRNTAVEDGAPPAEIEAIDKLFEEYFLREVKKVDGICYALQTFSEAEDAARREAKRLTERADAHRAKFDRIKAATLKAMQDHGVRVLETPTNKLRVQANGGKEPLEVDDPRLLPAELQTQTVKLSMKQWEEVGRWLGHTNGGLEVWHKIDDKLNWNGVEPDNEAIRAALKQLVPCPECIQGRSVDYILPDCPRCEGRGTVPNTVPGAKLLPRGEHLRIS